MTNHTPSFTSSAATVSFSETANTTNSATAHLAFKDTDKTDTHTTSATLASVAWSGGSTIPTAVRTDLNAAMSSSILSDSNGSGTIKWSFGAADRDFDFLANNETLTLTYNISVSDNHGGTTTQTVRVTVTGTDDRPVFSVAAGASVTEQAGHTLSLAPDTAHIALNFVDADLDNTGHTATVIGATASGSTAGILPGSLGNAELMSFFDVDNVNKARGSSNGVINTTFSAPDLAFDYLAAGEHLTITYVVQLDDHAGGVTTQNVVVTVVGTNDAPIYISGPESAHLVEGQHVSPAGNLTASGDLIFTDIDLSDTHTVSTTVTAARSGGGAIPLSNAALLAAMSTSLVDSTGHLLGDVGWNFSISNSAASFLAAGETLTLTYTIAVADPSHATDTQTVTVTILGTNHPVVITSGPESAAVTELAGTTGSATLDTTGVAPSGTLAFSDADTGDSHTVAVALASETWSGGAGVPAATHADLLNAVTTVLHDSTGTGTGSLDWTFAIPDRDLDFLAAGETLTVNYNVRVSDASTNATQTVSVVVTGANDAPVITSGPGSASLSEQPDVTGSASLDSTSPVPTGTLAFSDVDRTDTHSVNVALASAIWSANPDAVLAPDLQADLLAGLATTLHDSTGTGSGGVDWSFSIPDHDLDFLSAGETLTVTFNVTVSDAAADSTQTVTVTINGAQDALTVNPVTAAAADSPFLDDGNVIAAGNLFLDGNDTGGDQSTMLAVTAVNGQAGNVGTFIAGIYGSVLVADDGSYLYIANANVDPLQAGDHVTDQVAFTVTDSLGRTQSTTLTIAIDGADDAPVVTSALAFGAMTEDAGPSAVVNGGFETGDFSGWSSSAGASVAFVGIGGAFGNYAASLSGVGSLFQSVATATGQHYTLSFVVAGDTESPSTSFSAFWDGAQILGVTDVAPGFTTYTFDVVGDGASGVTSLVFSYADGGTGMLLDQVTVESPTGPATESAAGSIAFSDIETGDTHAAAFAPQGGGFVGTFSLDPVSEIPGSGSVGWHFTVNNADIQFLAQGQTLSQIYTVTITDSHGAATTQDVTIAIEGANDAPTAVDETVITDVGPNGTVDIPAWALAVNDTDPDTTDVLAPNAILSSSGGTAVPFIDAFFIDDATPGGSFTYTVTDGIATSGAATATIVNTATTATTLTGTGGDDIIIANNGTEALIGGGGNDVLIGNAGAHILTGGTGNDVFTFLQPDNTGTITDFNAITEHDRIAVSASGYGGGLSAHMDVAPVFETSDDNAFQSAFSRFHFDTTNHTLYFSADGTTESEVALAQLQPGVTLHPVDLLIV